MQGRQEQDRGCALCVVARPSQDGGRQARRQRRRRRDSKRGRRYGFFLQAGGGIRDYKVTGVQTCALPIFIFLVCLPLIFAQKAPPPDLPAAARLALAVISGKLKAPGLQQPVEVLRDRWGVAHIYARKDRKSVV